MIDVVTPESQFFQFFPAGKVKTQRYPDPVNELAGRNIPGIHEGFDFHEFPFPGAGKHILRASRHMHHIKRLPPQGRFFS